MADTPPVYIHAAAALGPQQDFLPAQRAVLTADAMPASLKALLKSLTGQSLRQASHFVELATVGSQLCMQRANGTLAADTAVYLGTGLADVQTLDSVFSQVVRTGTGLASPFDFINSANNMAAFYVAKLASLSARNLTITQSEFSFECALQLGCADVAAGAVTAALVGGVDEASLARAQYQRRLTLRDDQIRGGGSGWLYLRRQREGAIGEIVAVDTFIDADWMALAARVAELRKHSEPALLLPGFCLDAEDRKTLSTKLDDVEVRNYLAYCGCYYTASAFGIAETFDHGLPPTLIAHVNKAGDRTMLVVVRTFAR